MEILIDRYLTVSISESTITIHNTHINKGFKYKTDTNIHNENDLVAEVENYIKKATVDSDGEGYSEQYKNLAHIHGIAEEDFVYALSELNNIIYKLINNVGETVCC